MIKLKLSAVPDREDEFELFIECDSEGVELLKEAMELLLDGKNDHIHFMDESWGAGQIESDRTSTQYWIPHIQIGLVSSK